MKILIILDVLTCFCYNLIFRLGYSSTIVGWCSKDKRAKMQQEGVKTWWKRFTLEVTSINLEVIRVEDLEEVIRVEDLEEVTNTNILVNTRTLLCLQALQRPDQAAGCFHNMLAFQISRF